MNKISLPPANVTILAVFVLCITAWNGLRAYSTIANWQILREFGAIPAYSLVIGLVWALTGLWLFRALWEGQRYALRAGLASAGLYFLWYWFDRLTIQPSPAPNLLFSVVFSTLLLIIFIIVLGLPASRAFFDKEQG